MFSDNRQYLFIFNPVHNSKSSDFDSDFDLTV